MANRIPNHGIYAGLISEYVRHKRSLGYKMEDVEERLRRFDQLTIDRGETEIGISKELADEWCRPLPMESVNNRYGRVSILRGFSSYLQTIGYESYVPRLPKVSRDFVPHIFTRQEMAAIFRECDRLTLTRHYMDSVRCTMPCLVRMLYGTGIRIGEAMRLTHADVDFTQGVLILRGCKNGQDRLVPVSLSLREVCKDWVAYKERLGLPVDAGSPFFTSANGRRFSESSVYETFRTVLQRAGIGHGGRGAGPRLHDLRHTFCVNALAKLSEDGTDLYCSMPILMTYMGHQSPGATDRYVRLTKEMFPHLLMKMDDAYRYVFPEIGKGLTEEDSP
jgi:integrase